jgi:hypothetical protein
MGPSRRALSNTTKMAGVSLIKIGDESFLMRK